MAYYDIDRYTVAGVNALYIVLDDRPESGYRMELKMPGSTNPDIEDIYAFLVSSGATLAAKWTSRTPNPPAIAEIAACFLSKDSGQKSALHACGELAGEPTTTTAILMSMYTTISDGLHEADPPGKTGQLCFQLSTSSEFTTIAQTTAWFDVDVSNDYICKQTVTGLTAGTTYYYRVLSRVNPAGAISYGLPRRFKTAPLAATSGDVKVAFTGDYGYKTPDSQNDVYRGYQTADMIRYFNPDFIVRTGDFIYADGMAGGFPDNVSGGDPLLADPAVAAIILANPNDWWTLGAFTAARNIFIPAYNAINGVDAYELLVFKKYWAAQYAFSTLQRMFGQHGIYCSMSDHDFWKDNFYGTEVNGHDIFINNNPIPAGNMYRSIQWGADLEVFITNAREYRVPTDVPGKYFGATQYAWLVAAVVASTASFKIVVADGPTVGCGTAVGVPPPWGDNMGEEPYLDERTDLLTDLAAVDNLFFVNGDRHWAYHSHDVVASKHEFCHGASSNGHAIAGTDPDVSGLVVVDYGSRPAPTNGGGGFLGVLVDSVAATITFNLYDYLGMIKHGATYAHV